MAAGLQVDREYLNNKVGAVAIQLRNSLESAEHLTAALAPYDLAGLVSTFGLTEADAQSMLDALYAISVLVGLAHGTQTLSSPTDFRVGLAKVTGID